jgi:hypothetical protein
MHKAYGESFHVLFVSFVYWKRIDMTILFIRQTIYPLVMTNIAMVYIDDYRWPIEIDGLPNLKMVIFHGYVK